MQVSIGLDNAVLLPVYICPCCAQVGLFATQVMARPSLSNSMLHGRWGGRDTMHSTVNHADEVITMYQIARMAPQQIAVIWQVNYACCQLRSCHAHARHRHVQLLIHNIDMLPC